MAAQQELVNIPNDFELAGNELTEYQFFNSLKNMQISAAENGQSDAQMLLANQAAILQIADAGTHYASAQAQALVNSVQGIVYDPEIFLPTPGGSPQLLVAPNTGITPQPEILESYLKASPNPAKGKVMFSYRLPEEFSRGTVTITSIEGRTVKVFNLTESEGAIGWDTSGMPEGIYLFSLMADGKALLTDRLSVIR